MAIFTFVNTLNYLDRGIVAGAGTLIRGCFNEDVCDARYSCSSSCRVCGSYCEGKEVTQSGFGISEMKLGFAQSAFMVGYLGASLFFSHAVHVRSPFRLISVGISIWILAVALSGLSGLLFLDNEFGFWVLVFGRMLSGVGEAAMACISLPFLHQVLPEGTKGSLIAIYFAAIPVGTAMGFVYSGYFSSIFNNRWEYLFLFEIPFALPFPFLFWNLDPRFALEENDDDNGGVGIGDRSPVADESSTSPNELSLASIHDGVGGVDEAENDELTEPLLNSSHYVEETLWQEIRACLSSPVFMAASFGYAAFTGVTAGLGFYLPTFLQDYRPFDPRWDFTEATADVAFGLMVMTAGFVGTVLGGVLVDRRLPLLGYRGEDDVAHALQQIVFEVSCASVVCVCGLALTSPALWFANYAVGITLAFTTTAATNFALLGSVPRRNRAMAMAVSLCIVHAFGDVPSPILLGLVADTYSPLTALSSVVLLLPPCVLLWTLGFVLQKRRKPS